MKPPIFFVSLLLSSLLLAQTGEPLRFEKIDGLSQNTAYSILKDKQGFLWIATADGLNRYDGVEMKIYKPGFNKQKEQMKGRIIRSALIEDEKERIWFSTDLVVNSFNKKNESFAQHSFYVNKQGQ